MSNKSSADPADLLKEAKRLQAQEAALKRDRLALAKKLIQAGQDLGGDDLELETAAPKPKRRYTRRRRTLRTPAPPPAPKTSPAPTAHAAPSQTKGRRFSTTGWTATMIQILQKADRPLTYAELKAEIAKTHLGPKLLRTDKSFYGGLGKLEARQEAIRHNGRISTPPVHERYMRDVAAGIVQDEPVVNSGGEHHSPRKEALLAFLEVNVEGARVGEIINALEKQPKLNLSGRNSRTAVYNLIARLIRREVLVRDGDIIRLPRRTNGAYHNEQPSSQTPMT